MTTKPIISFGEVLWDMLPTGKLLGGAPLNVIYHAEQMGLSGNLISCVGTDTNGVDILSALDQLDISTDFIASRDNWKTGVAEVVLDDKGAATYDLVTDVSYDHIPWEDGYEQIISPDTTIVYGTLAARMPESRGTLLRLLKSDCRKVMDVNLRPPHYEISTVIDLCKSADIIKVNEEELGLLGKWLNCFSSTDEDLLSELCSLLEASAMICTKGKEGVIYVNASGQKFHVPSEPVSVVDTVGSGDAFLAAFISGLYQDLPIEKNLKRANHIGGWVATQIGATPVYDNNISDEV